MNPEFNIGMQQDNDKSPERLEDEVNATRARIGDRLETLSNRLSPGDLLDQALGMAREHGGDFTRNLGAQMKSNPVPTLLTGIGLAWLMMSSGSRSEGYSNPFRRTRSESDDSWKSSEGSYSGSLHDSGDNRSEPGVIERAKDALGNAGDHVEEFADAARRKIDSASEATHRGLRSARQSVRSAQGSVADFLHEQPVLAASLGVAFGAALGALLPSTDLEERVMGPVSDKAVTKAQAVATAQYAKAKASAEVVAQNTRQVLQGGADNPSSGQAAAGSTAPINQAG